MFVRIELSGQKQEMRMRQIVAGKNARVSVGNRIIDVVLILHTIEWYPGHLAY